MKDFDLLSFGSNFKDINEDQTYEDRVQSMGSGLPGWSNLEFIFDIIFNGHSFSDIVVSFS